MPQATSLAAELKKEFAADVNLVQGANGAFEVTVDGKLVYSKNRTHRFPETGEIPKLLGHA
ncbi:MAG: SelT/SelW/SelH family protein [Candidatus Lambdaproteobacteria bacterium]|nr:SelT/SelW/SelH family protein [Candidatus Lambdaproteobacteria bacterium]